MRFMFWGLARTAGLSASLVTAILVWPCSGYAAYWNVFNLEGESSISAEFVTYATLSDMLHDTNRTGDVAPSQPFVDANIVDSGSDGKTYWNLFNLEGESSISAEFVTYATLSDMLHDTNRTGDVAPSQPLVDANIVGSGADIIQNAAVPEPRSLALLCTGLLGFGLLRIRRRRF